MFRRRFETLNAKPVSFATAMSIRSPKPEDGNEPEPNVGPVPERPTSVRSSNAEYWRSEMSSEQRVCELVKQAVKEALEEQIPLPTKYLTKNQLAEILQITPRTVENLMRAGRLPFLTVGRQVRFRLEQVDAELERMQHARLGPVGLLRRKTASTEVLNRTPARNSKTE
jgi:excisionase family DNA binding protein